MIIIFSLHRSYFSIILEIIQQIIKKRILIKCKSIPNKNNQLPSPSNSNIHSSKVIQKANLPLLITSNSRYNNNILLPPLKRINRINLHSLPYLPPKRLPQ
jgi:hypothetical protein